MSELQAREASIGHTADDQDGGPGAGGPITAVAEFFQDARVRKILSGQPPSQPGTVLQDFFDNFDYSDCTIDQLLALADLSFICKDLAICRATLGKAIETGQKLHLVYYKMARIDFAVHDLSSAVSHLDAGIAADPSFPYNWMWSARALHTLGDADASILRAEKFVSFAVRPHAAEDLAVLSDMADAIFRRGDRVRAKPFYKLLEKHGPPSPQVRLRLGEAHLASQEHQLALRMLEPLETEGKLNHWGRCALAICLSHVGQHDRAIDIAESIVVKEPKTEHFVRVYSDVLARSKAPQKIRVALAKHRDLLPIAALAELEARVLFADGALDAAADRVLSVGLTAHSRPYYLCVEMAYRSLEASRSDISLRLSDALLAAAPTDLHVKLMRVDIFFRLQEWERAAEMLDAIPPEDAAKPHAILKRFEYYCFVSDMPRATELWEQIETMTLPSKQFMLPVFRFLAERQMWDELVGRALAWLDASFRYDQIGYVFFRAAKKTKRHAELIAKVEGIEGWAENDDLAKLRATLAWDSATSFQDMERLAADPSLSKDPVIRRKMDIKRAIWARSFGREKRRAVFLCTNRSYLCATVVALHSAIEANEKRVVDYFIVVDDDLVDLANGFIAQYQRDGLSVRVVPAQEVVDAAEKLYASYGLFTSGHVLASAAYYRIYFAKYLHRLGGYDRALYLDSDIIVRRPLEQLYVANLRGLPLAARLETMRPEVRRAIELHKIERDRYFNSGILLFDFANDQLSTGLDGAVTAIGDDGTTLLFHDQCALNLGFKDRFADLDMNYNYPVGEATRLADVPEQATIIHFLDRPKPWSAAYTGECANLWFDKWYDTAQYIGEAQAIELFGLTSD